MQPIREMLANAEVTEQQWRVLRVLYEEGECEAHHVASRACLFMSSMTRIAQTLETKGLVQRRPHDSDRRRLLINITPAGSKIIDDNAPQSREISERLRAKYGTKKLETLLDLLNDLDHLEY